MSIVLGGRKITKSDAESQKKLEEFLLLNHVLRYDRVAYIYLIANRRVGLKTYQNLDGHDLGFLLSPRSTGTLHATPKMDQNFQR